MCTPKSTSTQPASTVPTTFAGAEMSRTSSISPTRNITAAAISTPRGSELRAKIESKPSHQARQPERGDEPDEHRDAAHVGQRRGVHRAIVRQVHPPDAGGEPLDERCDDEGDDRGDRPDEQVGADAGHGVTVLAPAVSTPGSGRTGRRRRPCTAASSASSVRCAQGAGDERGDLRHLGLLHALRGDRRGADAHAARDERAARVVGDRVLVQRDAGEVEDRLGLLAGEVGVERAQVDHHQVVVGAAADTRRKPCCTERLGERAGVDDDLLRVLAEARLGGLVERDGLAGDDVLERAALPAGEHGLVDRGGVLGLATGCSRRAGRAASCGW